MQVLAAILFWALRKFVQRFKKLSDGKMFWLPYALYVLAWLSLLFQPIPGWGESVVSAFAAVVSWVFGWLAAWLGGTAGIFASVALIIVILGTVADLKDKKADKWARYIVFASAPLAMVASAQFAPWLLRGIQALGGVGPQVLSTLA